MRLRSRLAERDGLGGGLFGAGNEPRGAADPVR